MEKVRSGALPFSKLEVLHRHKLDRVLADLQPDEVLMVAAHSDDLAAAAAAGLRTAFIARPDEKGPGRGESAASVPVEFSADSLTGLASSLGRGAG